jgi:hypothetical protein
MGTKLHRVVVKLAVEIMDKCPLEGFHQFKLRDDLFWFGKPKLLLWLIHLISFQVGKSKASVFASEIFCGIEFLFTNLFCRMHSRWQHSFGPW